MGKISRGKKCQIKIIKYITIKIKVLNNKLSII